MAFPIDRFSRYCLVNGIDQLGYLLERNDAITRYEQGARMSKKIVVLAGDGVGPEVTAEAVRVLKAVSTNHKLASRSRMR